MVAFSCANTGNNEASNSATGAGPDGRTAGDGGPLAFTALAEAKSASSRTSSSLLEEEESSSLGCDDMPNARAVARGGDGYRGGAGAYSGANCGDDGEYAGETGE